MPEKNRRLVLAERPTGNVEESTVRLEEEDAPQPAAGEALVRSRFLSIDPTIRTWMDDAPGYLPPIAIGEVVRCGAVGEVVSSNSERYSEGDLVFGMSGWQDYAIADEGERTMQVLPDGIDLYFDNVGGDILDACLAQLALRGRIVLCGAIATYNDRGGIRGPANYRALIARRGRMEGFIILDYIPRFPEAQAQMGAWIAEGRIKFRTHVVEGLENAPGALNLLFTGGNTGKVIVAV